MLKADIIDLNASTNDTYLASGTSTVVFEVSFGSTTLEYADFIEFVLPASATGLTLTHGLPSPSPHGGCGSNTGNEMTAAGPGWGTPMMTAGNSGCGAFLPGTPLTFGLSVTSDGTFVGDLPILVRVIGDGEGGTSASIAETTVTVGQVTCALICPTVSPVASEPDMCGANVTIALPTQQGTCMAAPADQSGFYPVGETSVTFTTTDDNGASVSCITIVTVNDNTSPQIAGCANVETAIAEGDCGVVFALPITDVTDNCGAMAMSLSAANDDSFVNDAIACPGGNSSFWREYSTDAYGVNTGLDVSSVRFRVFESSNNPEITVNLYELPGGSIAAGSLELVASATQSIGNLSDAMATIPISASFEPGSFIAVEIVVPGSQFFGAIMGVNGEGESSPTYVTSGFCQIDNPTTLAGIGFPNAATVIILDGEQPAVYLEQLDDTDIAVGDTISEGTYNFQYRAVDASGNVSNLCEFTYTVAAFDGAIIAVACNDEIQVSLEENCEVVITADMILEGGPYGCFEDYTVEITDEDDVNYGNTLTMDNIGQTLKARVISPVGNSCWGRIILEDKAPPALECIDVYTTCQGDLEPGSPVSDVVTYRATLNSITEDLPATGTTTRNIAVPVFGLNGSTVTNVAVRFDISHEAVSDLAASITSPDGVTRSLFIQPGGTCTEDNIQIMINPAATLTAADLSDTCAVGADYAITGRYQPTSDLSVYNGMDPNGDWTITISDLTDGNGGTVNNVELVLSQSGADVSFPTTKDITYIPINEYTFRVEGLDGCGIATVGYSDDFATVDCEGEFDKIVLRTWTATDAAGNNSEVCTQNIYVYRSGLESIVFPRNYDGLDLPSLSCELYADEVPGVDVTGGISGELCDIVQIFEPEDTRLDICEGSYKILRKFKVLQWCSGEVVEHTQVIKVLDDEGPVLSEVPDTTFSADDFDCTADVVIPKPEVLSDCSDMFTYSLQYLKATSTGPAPTDEIYINEDVVETGSGDFIIEGLTFGNTWIKWTVEDECGNKSYEYFTLTIDDQIAPTAVCDEFTVVSVDGDGRIRVDAISFDDGSHDNCGVQDYMARKMVDVCNSGSTVYGEYVEFCCEEIGNGPIMVEFLVTDFYGNSNTCMVEVEVQDKLPPYITDCPDDITLDCQANFLNFDITGEAEAIDNCGEVTVTYEDDGELDTCGEGVINRTWTATDAAGLKHTCIQVITVLNSDPFVEMDIDWPDDYEATTCEGGSLDPEDLPAGSDYPTYDEGFCSLVATTYKDQVFTTVDGACEKILRTWTVLDWCVYDESNPQSTAGVYTRVQIVKLKNTIEPVINNCQDMTVDVFGDCEGQVSILLDATDDCTPAEELLYTNEINLYNDDVPDPSFDGNSNGLSETLPVGIHEVKWTVEDKCGNIERCTFLLTVRDGKKPTPYCRGTVVTAVMNSNGEIDIWASDFDLGSYDNCTPQEELLFSFSSSVNDTRRVFSCDDIPDGEQALIPLRMYVTDLAGNQDYCDITVHVQDNEADFCDPEDGNSLTISGTIETEQSRPVPNAHVSIMLSGSNEPVKQTYTDTDGKYRVTGLSGQQNYDVLVDKNDDVRNGVNTLDLVKIQRHILDLEPFSSVYDYIAADVNNNESIRASDLLALRKVILGVNTEFPAGQRSWRFVPADYQFEDVTNPFPFAEHIYLNDMQHSANYENMLAVKIGDIDNSVNPLVDDANEVQNRSSKTLSLLVDEQPLAAGSQVEVPVYATQLGLYGYQFTLALHGVSFAGVNAGQLAITDEHIGVFDGMITTAWSSATGMDVYTDEPLFTLVFDVNENTSTNNALAVTSKITEAMAFDIYGNTMEVELAARSADAQFDKFTLFQNKPNPFTSATEISFYLPSPQDVQLNIYDVTGKIILSKSTYFGEGVQSFNIDNDELAVSGVLYYEVSAGPYRSTMKMISIR